MKKQTRIDLLATMLAQSLSSRWFWRLTIVLFAVQAAFIAFVGRFSMAFDEHYHFGAIQAYARVWLPWDIQQPGGPAVFSSLTTDPSYLYHYLMSFPYRVLHVFVENQTAEIVMLRLMDVGFVLAGLYIFRKLLLRLGMSRAATHGSLFFITLLPVVPFLAGQLTYDAFLFFVSAVCLAAVLRLSTALYHTQEVSIARVLGTGSLMLLAAQVKYAFLPVLAAWAVFLAVQVLLLVRHRRDYVHKLLQGWKHSILKPMAIAMVLLSVMSAGLFLARYGTNIVQYHSPVPACDVVLSSEECMAFGPYQRDENHRQQRFNELLTTQDKVTYPLLWFNQMLEETYFAVGSMEIGYPTGPPLPVSYTVGYAVALASFVLLIWKSVFLWRRGVAERLLLVCISFYTLVLFGTNLQVFLETGAPVAIHGRYLMLFFPAIAYLVYRAAQDVRFPERLSCARFVMIATVLLLTFYGGGIAPFIIRSSDEWVSPYAVETVRVVRSVLWHEIIK